MRAREASRRAPVTIRPEQTLAEAARLMDEQAVGSVLVVEGTTLVGIVTDRDITVRGTARGHSPESRVDGVMTTEVTTLDADADLRDALKVFSNHPVRRLPLVDAGGVVGVLSVDDLVIDLANDLATLTRPVTGQVIFGHREPSLPATTT